MEDKLCSHTVASGLGQHQQVSHVTPSSQHFNDIQMRLTALGGSSSCRSSQICPILWGAEANLLRLCSQKASSGRVSGSSCGPWYSGSFLADQDTPFMFC